MMYSVSMFPVEYGFKSCYAVNNLESVIFHLNLHKLFIEPLVDSCEEGHVQSQGGAISTKLPLSTKEWQMIAEKLYRFS